MDDVLLRCGLWEEVDHNYPGGVFRSACGFCGAITGTSVLNYGRATKDGNVRIACPTCYPKRIAATLNQGEAVMPQRMIRCGKVDDIDIAGES